MSSVAPQVDPEPELNLVPPLTPRHLHSEQPLETPVKSLVNWNWKHAFCEDVGVGALCVVVMKGLARITKGQLEEAVIRRWMYVVMASRVAIGGLIDVIRRQKQLIKFEHAWDEGSLQHLACSIVDTGWWFRVMMFSDLMMQSTMRPTKMTMDMLVHHLGYYGFVWYAFVVMNMPTIWRDLVRSGGWQVLACEMLGAANSAAIASGLQPRKQWVRAISVGTILGVRTPIHLSMLYCGSHPVKKRFKTFTWSCAIFGLTLDRTWLISALWGTNRRASVD